MNNEERLDKLVKAISLVREVEFSYPINSPARKRLYKFVVDNFSLTGDFMALVSDLRDIVDLEDKDLEFGLMGESDENVQTDDSNS